MDLLIQNLVSPIVLAFVLGMVARWVKSDLEIPDALYQGISIYLLFAIGLKGGAALSETTLSAFIGPLGVTLFLAVLTPISAFFALRWIGKLDRVNAAAAAAHFGSVSAVTFLAAIEAAKYAGLSPEAFLPALVAVLEVPGIIIGLMFAQQQRSAGNGGVKAAVHEVVTGKSIFLLVGGMAIGWACGVEKINTVAPFFIAPFKGVLCLFLLELGMVAARRLQDARKAGWRLIFTGCLLPFVHGLLGTVGGVLVGMDPGGAAVLGAMVGSASYIAAPAAVRIALPSASPGIYLTLALGITFPFNLAIGIPTFLTVAKALSDWMSQ